MTPEEIVHHIHQINRQILQARPAGGEAVSQQMLELMETAALRGFQFGSNVAMSMVQGALLVQLVRLDGARKKHIE